MTRIDVHHHFLPQVWVEEIARHPEHPPMPQGWNMEADLKAMDALGIDIAMLSITSPGVYFGDTAAATRMAAQVNDEAASMVAAHPDRYGSLASLPLPNVEASVAEAVRALDELGADGVTMMTSAAGMYLADERMKPLWKVLDERSAVVFVHPTSCDKDVDKSMIDVDAWVEFPAETTRMASQMVLRGLLREFPNVRIILSHAGGFLPFQTGRFEALATIMPGVDAEAIKADLSSFYFDTALSTAPATLNALLEHAPHDHVVFGTDYPAAPLPVAQRFAELLDTYTKGDADLARQINSANALQLFPRLAARAA